MFAVVEREGKQYKVSEGDVLDIEALNLDPKKSFVFQNVLLISKDKNTTLGAPYIDGASVNASVVEEYRDKKVLVFKFKRKTGKQVTQGHRQSYTRIKIDTISTKLSNPKTTDEPVEKAAGKVEEKETPKEEKVDTSKQGKDTPNGT
ncbi:MAG: 50S ribosomal protein L21 [Candidatus Margulisbacteria bacterium]|nr:50S ribosomal protein L21 [Candidatus Margulisiibacteriota bacterium]